MVAEKYIGGKRLWYGTVALTVVLAMALQFVNGALITDAAPWGIASFELAFTESVAASIVESWGEDGLRWAYLSMLLDFAFPAAYASVLALAIARVGTRLIAARHPQAAYVLPLIRLQVATALCDYIENIALVWMLYFGSGSVSAFVAGVFASIKFAMLGLSIGYLVVARFALRA